MNQYLVTLRLYIGTYEKHTTHLVEAENQQDAQVTALRAESHNDDAGFDDDDWHDDDMGYRVEKVKRLTNGEAQSYRLITGKL